MSRCQHLIRLAEAWRTKAAHIRAKHGAKSPNLAEHCAVALECCAEELEEEIRRTPPEKP